jgi:glycosyltransferase involved in cell wall biosynthesis
MGAWSLSDLGNMLARTQALGVVLPVHNEEDLLGEALEAIAQACEQVGTGIPCTTVIVLDHCSDASGKISRQWAKELRHRDGSHQAMVRRSRAAGVGNARRMGTLTLLRRFDGIDPQRIWLATTDADSRVPSNWLNVQLAAHEGGADVWSGRVSVEDWSHHHPRTEWQWTKFYESEVTPIHGASLGFNGRAYLDSGGFPRLCSGEDRALYRAIVARGGRAVEDRDARVVTSARTQARAPLGFSSALSFLDDEQALVGAPRLAGFSSGFVPPDEG